MSSRKIQSVAFVSLGCPKNLVDSERMLGLLAGDGLAIASDPADADAIVINTCGFLEASKEESLGAIRDAVAMKEKGRCQRVIVAGCLVQRHKTKLLSEVPEIDRLVGVFDREHIVEAVRGRKSPRQEGGHWLGKYHGLGGEATKGRSDEGEEEGTKARRHEGTKEGAQSVGFRVSGVGEESKAEAPKPKPETRNPGPETLNPGPETLNPRPERRLPVFEDDRARLRLTPRHYAYLRMSEGCNQGCSFCTIPGIRGPMRSKPVEQILAEARELAADGAVELNLIGQDTTSYGTDLGYEPGLAGLLRALDRELKDVHWLRLMYAYPSCFSDEMIRAIADCGRVVKYIDIPLQHINDEVLTRMKRRVTRKQTQTLLEKLRQWVPGLAIRTTFIAGSPGETEQQHQELVKFVREFGFDMMGVFTYSREPGTAMGRMEGQIPEEVKKARVEELMLAQQEVAFAKAKGMVGREVEVVVEEESDEATKRRSDEGKGTKAREERHEGTKARRHEGREAEGRSDEATKGRGEALFVARSQSQAPEIDSVTYLSGRGLHVGQIVRATVVDWQAYDLVARVEAKGTRSLAVLRG